MNNGGSETTAATRAGPDAPPSLIALSLGSVGVVYGDIGTSPLYAFREAAMAASNDAIVTREIVLGVLSLILWALIITVTLKYVLILLRADNNGEGGTLSLTALATRALGRRTAFVFIVGVIGASMFLGNSVITPAISVLSAVEGLKLASPAFGDFVVPLTVIILIALFAAQAAAPPGWPRCSAPSWSSGLSRSQLPAGFIYVTIQPFCLQSIRITA